MIAAAAQSVDLVGGLLWTGGIVVALAIAVAIGEKLGLGEMLMFPRIKDEPPRASEQLAAIESEAAEAAVADRDHHDRDGSDWFTPRCAASTAMAAARIRTDRSSPIPSKNKAAT